MGKKLLLSLLILSASYSLIAQPYVYNFNGDFTGSGTTLTPVLTCAAANGAFNTEAVTTVCGTGPVQGVYQFNAGEGISFDNAGSEIGDTYTIHLLFRFNAYPVNTYQRLFNFSNTSNNDFGLYAYQSCTVLSPNLSTCNPYAFGTGQFFLATLVRDGTTGQVDFYIDGQLADSYNDLATAYYVPATATTPIVFFTDDACEVGDGAVRYLSLSPTASTPVQVAAAAAALCNAVLPLSLLDFSADKQSSSVTLKWTTESEVNSNHFEVERSADGHNFSKITSIAANNTPSRNSYSFIDRQPLTGTGFYRLKIMDNDGRFKYSGILKISFGSTQKFEVFPNPVKESVTISGIQGNKMVKLLNIEGKELIQKVSTGQTMTLDLNKYPSGIYIITYSDGETIQRQKIIKN